jgi:uncharacterized protein YcbX
MRTVTLYRLSGLAVLIGMTIEGIASILYSRAGGVALYLDPLVPADDLAKLFGSLIFLIGLPGLYRDTVTDFQMPAGTFFDIGVVHLLTTATLDRLRARYPRGRFEARRFRPNIVVSIPGEDQGFAENDRVGRTVAIGGDVRLAITEPCARCVMITLPQGDLPKDSGILRTAAHHNGVNVGVYASVLNGGTIRRGDPVALA